MESDRHKTDLDQSKLELEGLKLELASLNSKLEINKAEQNGMETQNESLLKVIAITRHLLKLVQTLITDERLLTFYKGIGICDQGLECNVYLAEIQSRFKILDQHIQNLQLKPTYTSLTVFTHDANLFPLHALYKRADSVELPKSFV